jgi:hypothetical protein
MERKIYKGNDPESGEAKEYFYDYEAIAFLFTV